MRRSPCFMLSTHVTLALMLLASSLATRAQTLSVLYQFGSNTGDPSKAGEYPGVVAQGRDCNLYSTSYRGGASGQGTFFKITPAGALRVLYSFDGTHGANPWSGLTLGSDGNFYGTTAKGGTSSNGTIFKVTPSGTLTVLYNFTGAADGGTPYAPPIQGTDGNWYGTTIGGNGYGTVYKLTSSGTLTTLHQFNNTDGSTPRAALVQGIDGNFYSTAGAGGTGNLGTDTKSPPPAC